MSGFDALDWFLAAIFGLISIISLSVKFDLNEWLKERRRIKEERLGKLLQEACPHLLITKGKSFSQFIQKSNGAWQCDSCGKTTHDENFVEYNIEYWTGNLEKYVDANEKRQELIEKLNRL